MRVSIAAHAKINLTLDVLGKLPNGYHELLMVMQSITLHDMLSIETGTGEGIELRSNIKGIPCDERNLVFKAIRAFYEASGIPEGGVSVAIEKRIPVMAGLAGGSTDAAAVIRALDYVHNTRFTEKELQTIGLTVGADVPFCISGGTMLACGIGEQLSPLPPMPDCAILLVKPALSISTPYVFAALDCTEIVRHPDADAMARALGCGDLRSIADRLCNVMEGVTAAEHPEIDEIKERLLSYGALGAVMSGSGPTVFGIFAESTLAYAAYAALLPCYEVVHLCRPCPANSAPDFLTAETGVLIH